MTRRLTPAMACLHCGGEEFWIDSKPKLLYRCQECGIIQTLTAGSLCWKWKHDPIRLALETGRYEVKP